LCEQTIDQYEPCTSDDPNWEICGNFITVEGGEFYNGARANKSNFPDPVPQNSPQWIKLGLLGLVIYLSEVGGGLCCVEAKMRRCCAELGGVDRAKVYEKKRKKCDEKRDRR
jgi:hypothetical protein